MIKSWVLGYLAPSFAGGILIPGSLSRRGAHRSENDPLEAAAALGVGAVAAGSADDEHASALAAARLAGRHVERVRWSEVVV